MAENGGPRSDENLVTRDGDRTAEFATDGRRWVEEGVYEVAGDRAIQAMFSTANCATFLGNKED